MAAQLDIQPGKVILEPFTVTTSPIIAFPRELREDLKNWPVVEFSVKPSRNNGIKGVHSVYLPIPPGISFSDNMAYSTLDLGIIGGLVNTLMNDQRGMRPNAGALERGASMIKRTTEFAKSFANGAGALTIAAGIASKMPIVNQIPGVDKIAEVINYNNKQILAPNTTTTFQGTAVRSFGFSFKLVSKDAKDTAAIRNIDHFFRRYTYPVGNQQIVAYPPVWTVKFYNGATRNAYIPGIWGCYLNGMNSTFNAGTNLWHADGSPIEVDFSLSFQETRALTRDDIEWLNSNEGEMPVPEAKT